MFRLFVAVCLFATCSGCGGTSSERDKPGVLEKQQPVTPVAGKGETPPQPRAEQGSLKNRKPDFVTTPGQIAKEWGRDSAEAGRKYQGKLVEIKGSALFVSQKDPPGTGLLFVFEEGATELKIAGSMVGCWFSSEERSKYQQLEELSEGQRVRIRGVGSDPDKGFGLVNCEFMEVGPSTAIPCTVAEINAAFAQSPDKAAAKYIGKMLVIRAKVMSAKKDKDLANGVRWELADPESDGKQTIPVWISAILLDKRRLESLYSIMLGQTIIVIGKSEAFGGTSRLTEARILQAPPQGVVLPQSKW